MSIKNKVLVLVLVVVLMFLFDSWLVSTVQPTLMTDVALQQMNSETAESAGETLRLVEAWKNYISFGAVGLTFLTLFWNNCWNCLYRTIGADSK